MTDSTLRPGDKRADPTPNASAKAPALIPGRDRRLGVIDRAAPAVLFNASVLDQILDDSAADCTRETGGFLLGRVFSKPRLTVTVEAYHPARAGRGTATSLQFTPEAWADFRQYKADLPREWDLVGWHHTHPGLGVFFSGYDRFVHAHYFQHPHQIATVVDPVAEKLVLFAWVAGVIADSGFVVREATAAASASPESPSSNR